jgi:hypothetical protein
LTQKLVNERRFAVVDVGDNGYVSQIISDIHAVFPSSKNLLIFQKPAGSRQSCPRA